jgi:hypothetical protein
MPNEGKTEEHDCDQQYRKGNHCRILALAETKFLPMLFDKFLSNV